MEYHFPINLGVIHLESVFYIYVLYITMHKYLKKHAKCQISCNQIWKHGYYHICATWRWILHYYEVRNVIHGRLMIKSFKHQPYFIKIYKKLHFIYMLGSIAWLSRQKQREKSLSDQGIYLHVNQGVSISFKVFSYRFHPSNLDRP